MKKRLKEFIESQSLSIRSFEEKIMCSNGRIQKFIKNDNVFGADVLVQIASNFPQLNMYWLMLGEGEMLLENDKNSLVPEKIYQEIRTENERLIRQNERLLVEVEQLKKQAAQKEPAAECATA